MMDHSDYGLPAGANPMPADADSRIGDPHDDSPVSDDPCVVALQEYQAVLEAGRRPDRAAFLNRVPDAAAMLTEAMDGLDFLYGAVKPDAATTDPLSGPDGRPGPAQLGDFRIVREVGRGGMGVVYEAEQLSLGRRVALKVLPFAAALDGKQLQRFKTEAQAAAQLHHTNIVPVFAVGADRGVHYYAMQFIDGQTLAGVIREMRGTTGDEDESSAGTVPYVPDASTAEQAVMTTRIRSPQSSGVPRPGPDYYKSLARLAVQAAEALEYAHSMGVVHRDVKPANLLIDGRGNLWVTDFGLAQFHGGDQTSTGDVLGTLRYMSPEQAEGRRGRVDHHTDIYSLGASLYELFTLQVAFAAKGRAELLRQILHVDPLPLRRVCRGVPVELETIVLKAVSKRPADRYETAQELADDLRRFVDDKPILARRPTAIQIAGKWCRRHTAVAATAVVASLIVMIVSVAAVFWLSAANRELREQKAKTQTEQQIAARNASVAEQKVDEANVQAARADASARAALSVLRDVALVLTSDRIRRDPEWGKNADAILDSTLKTCGDLARGAGPKPELRMEAIVVGQNVTEAFIGLGRADKAKKAAVEVIDWNRRLVQDFPNVWECRFLEAHSYRVYGQLLRLLGEMGPATEQFKLALAAWNEPGPMEKCPVEASLSYDNLADLLAQTGDHAGAETNYRQAYKYRKIVYGMPGQDKAHVCSQLLNDHIRLGHMRQMAGDRVAARDEYERARVSARQLKDHDSEAGDYGLAQAWCCLGQLLEVDDPAAAGDCYRLALLRLPYLARDHPGLPEYRQMLATVHMALGALAPAEGRAADTTGHFSAAREFLRRLAAELKDGSPGPGLPGMNEWMLACFLANCPDPQFREPALAVEWARKAVARAPQHADYLRGLGLACYRVDQFAESASVLERAIEMRGEGDPGDWMLLAAARWKLGQPEQARTARAKAEAWLEKYPGGRCFELLRMQAEVDGLLADSH
jgi:serine/threonine protein kinase/tetratricopeptide (TPR) repeat protein